MIPLQELRERQRETGIVLEVLEKDYCLGCLLKGIAASSPDTAAGVLMLRRTGDCVNPCG